MRASGAGGVSGRFPGPAGPREAERMGRANQGVFDPTPVQVLLPAGLQEFVAPLVQVLDPSPEQSFFAPSVQVFLVPAPSHELELDLHVLELVPPPLQVFSWMPPPLQVFELVPLQVLEEAGRSPHELAPLGPSHWFDSEPLHVFFAPPRQAFRELSMQWLEVVPLQVFFAS